MKKLFGQWPDRYCLFTKKVGTVRSLTDRRIGYYGPSYFLNLNGKTKFGMSIMNLYVWKLWKIGISIGSDCFLLSLFWIELRFYATIN